MTRNRHFREETGVMGTIWYEVAKRRDLLVLLVQRNLKLRYKGSVLGFFWSLLTPLLLIVVYAVFASILRFNQGRPFYLQYLVSGIIAWQFLAMCLNDSLHAVLGNANLVKKTAFPRIILPLSTMLANGVNFLLTLVVLVPFMMVSGLRPELLWLLPVVLLFHGLLSLGVSCLLSAVNVFFRDTQHAVGIGTLAWFFMSPVFYPMTMQLEKVGKLMPEWGAYLVFLNPMAGLLWLYRRMLMGGVMGGPLEGGDPACIDALLPWGLPAISLGMCVVVALIGVTVFQRSERHFGDVL
jgi:lipopolysaccharide transport system permease protein